MLSQATNEFLSLHNLYIVKLAVAAVVLAIVFQRKTNGRFGIRGLEISEFVDVSRRAEDGILAFVAAFITVYSYEILANTFELFVETSIGSILFFLPLSGDIAVWTVSILLIAVISLDFLYGSGDPFGRLIPVSNSIKEKF